MQSQSWNPLGSQQSSTTSQVKGPELNDRDRLNDILATEKYLTDSLNVAVREASHDALHQDVLQILVDTHRCARQAYDLMFAKGWYKLEAVEQQKLTQTSQQFGQYSSQFPYQSNVH